MATDAALAHDDTSVSVLARQLGVDWHTAWNAIDLEARARTSDPQRLAGVKTSEWMSILGAMRRCGIRLEVRNHLQLRVTSAGARPGRRPARVGCE